MVMKTKNLLLIAVAAAKSLASLALKIPLVWVTVLVQPALLHKTVWFLRTVIHSPASMMARVPAA